MNSHAPAAGPPVTNVDLRALKGVRPIVMVTAYDVSSARVADRAGVDAILVGDSVGMTVLGFDSTLPVTMDDMVSATRAVVRGTQHALVVGDMPFMSYQASDDDAMRNAGRLLAEGGAAAVKLEGGSSVAPLVTRMVEAGIPVMGHVGLTPQSVHRFGGHKVQGKDAQAARLLLEDCRALEAAGAFAVVLELVPAELAEEVTAALTMPTIGIGAGPGCDGQVQVFHDLLGIGDFTPRHARRYAEIGEAMRSAIAAYAEDVRAGRFPTEDETVHAPKNHGRPARTTAGEPVGGKG